MPRSPTFHRRDEVAFSSTNATPWLHCSLCNVYADFFTSPIQFLYGVLNFIMANGSTGAYKGKKLHFCRLTQRVGWN